VGSPGDEPIGSWALVTFHNFSDDARGTNAVNDAIAWSASKNTVQFSTELGTGEAVLVVKQANGQLNHTGASPSIVANQALQVQHSLLFARDPTKPPLPATVVHRGIVPSQTPCAVSLSRASRVMGRSTRPPGSWRRPHTNRIVQPRSVLHQETSMSCSAWRLPSRVCRRRRGNPLALCNQVRRVRLDLMSHAVRLSYAHV
jgi:hypothetical protein